MAGPATLPFELLGAKKLTEGFDLGQTLGLKPPDPMAPQPMRERINYADERAKLAEQRKRKALGSRMGFESTIVQGGMSPLNISTAPTLLGG